MSHKSTSSDSDNLGTPSPLSRPTKLFRPEYEYDSTPECSSTPSVSSTYSGPTNQPDEWWAALFEGVEHEIENPESEGYLGDDEGADDLSDEEMAKGRLGCLSGPRRYTLWKLEAECAKLAVLYRSDLKKCRREFPDDDDFKFQRKRLRHRYDRHFNRLRKIYTIAFEHIRHVEQCEAEDIWPGE